MGEVVDSLEIELKSAIKDVNKDLDALIGKLGVVAEGISAIGKNEGLEDFAKKASDIAKGLTGLQNAAKNISASIEPQMQKAAKSLDKIKETKKIDIDTSGINSAAKNTEISVERMKTQIQQGLEGVKIENPIDISELTGEQFKIFTRLTKEAEAASRAIQEPFEDAKEKISQSLDSISEAEKDAYRSRDISSEIKEKAKSATADLTNEFSKLRIPEINETNLKKLWQTFEKTNEKLEKLRVNLENGIDLGEIKGSFEDKKFANLQKQIALTEKTADALKEKMKSTGGEGFEELLNNLDKAEEKLHSLKLSIETGKVVEGTMEFKGLENQIKDTQREVDTLKEKLRGFSDTSGINSAAKNTEISVERAAKNTDKYAKTAKTAASISNKLSGALKSLSSSAKKVANSIGGAAKNLIKFDANTGINFRTILKYGFGIRSLFVLINKLRRALTEGMTNLVAYSSEVNTSLSNMKSSLNTTKNALAVAFAPIVNTIAPYIVMLIDLINKALNALGRLFSALTGKGFAVQAKKNFESIAAGASSAGGATKKAGKDIQEGIRSFDQLKVINTPEDSGGGGGGGAGGISADDMFETVKIEEKMLNLAEQIKKAWKNADFTEIGDNLGKQLEKALKSIPWKKINNIAKKGMRSLATFLNGFLVNENRWRVVGRTVAKGLNTITDALYEFYKTFKFFEFGKSLASGIDEAIRKFDWRKFGEMLGAKLRAMIKLAFGFVSKLKELGTFKALGEKIVDAVKGFFDEMGAIDPKTGLTGWQELGSTISDSLTGMLETITTVLEEMPWEDIGEAIADLFGKIDWDKIVDGLKKAITAALKGLWTAIKTAFKKDPQGMLKAITTIAKGWFTVKAFSAVFRSIGLLGGSLKDKLINKITGGILKGVKGVDTSEASSVLSNKLGSLGGAAGIAISAFVMVESVKWAKGVWKNLFSEYDYDEIQRGLTDMFQDALGDNAVSDTLASTFGGWGYILGGDASFKEWGDAFKMWTDDIVNGTDSLTTAIPPKFNIMDKDVRERLKNLEKSGSKTWSKMAKDAGKGLDGVTDAVSDELKNTDTAANTQIGKISKTFSRAFSDAKDKISKDAISISDNVTTAFDSLNTAADNLTGNIPDKITAAFGMANVNIERETASISHKVSLGFGQMNDKIKEEFGSVPEIISTALKESNAAAEIHTNTLKNKVSSAFDEIKTITNDKFKNVKTVLSDAFKEMDASAKDKSDSIKTTVSNNWNNIEKNTDVKWGDIKNKLEGQFQAIQQKADEKFTETKNTIGNKWSGIESNTEKKWGSISSKLSQSFNAIENKADKKTKSIKSMISESWDKIEQKTAEVWGGTKKTIEGATGEIEQFVRKMAKGSVSALNLLTDGLNQFKVKVQSNIPEIGEKDFSFKADKISVPGLANGAVLRGGSPFLAVVNDQKRGQTNVETPLKVIQEALRAELEKLGKKRTADTKTVDKNQLKNSIQDGMVSALNKSAFADFGKIMEKAGLTSKEKSDSNSGKQLAVLDRLLSAADGIKNKISDSARERIKAANEGLEFDSPDWQMEVDSDTMFGELFGTDKEFNTENPFSESNITIDGIREAINSGLTGFANDVMEGYMEEVEEAAYRGMIRSLKEYNEKKVLTEQNRILTDIAKKDFGISTDDIGKAARKYAKDYARKYGREAYS